MNNGDKIKFLPLPYIGVFDLNIIYQTSDAELLYQVLYTVNQVAKSQNTVIDNFNSVLEWANTQLETYSKEQLDKWLKDGTLASMVSSMLDDLQNQINNINKGKVDKNGSGQVTYQNLSQEVREMFTGGNTAVVGKNAVLETNLTPDCVSNPFLAVSKVDSQFNLYDNKTWVYGYVNSTGQITTSASYPNAIINYIPVSTAGSYQITWGANTNLLRLGYDTVNDRPAEGNSTTLLQSISPSPGSSNIGGGGYTLQVPSGTKYIYVMCGTFNPYITVNAVHNDNVYYTPNTLYGFEELYFNPLNYDYNKLIVVNDNQDIHVCIPVKDKGYADNQKYYIDFNITLARGTNYNIYQINVMNLVTFANGKLNIVKQLTTDGNFEIALQTYIDGALHQYGGTAHGYENRETQLLLIDDFYIQLGISYIQYCDSLTFFTRSIVSDEDNNQICYHNITYKFTIDGLEMIQSIEFINDFNMSRFFVGMLPIYRSDDNILVTDHYLCSNNTSVIDISNVDFTPVIYNNCYMYRMFSNYYNLIVDIYQKDSNYNYLTYITNSPLFNKYYSYPDLSGDIEAGTVINNTTVFKFSRGNLNNYRKVTYNQPY